MGYGGHFPYPRRFGGGRPRLKIIHDALNAARGTALDASNPDTIVWVENMAYARAICFDGYGFNDKIALQNDPRRMTDFLPRWEKILALTPAPGATDHERRLAVERKFKDFLKASSLHSQLVAKLQDTLPANVFGGIEYIGFLNAVIHVPDASYPWGTVVPGFPWYSTTARVLIRLEKPEGYTEQDFYAEAAKIGPAIDGLLPSWATFDWYRRPASGAAINVEDGPSAAGFYLDDEHNLDNSVFADSQTNPASLDLTAWLRAPFSGSPWSGTASDGDSGDGSHDATEATNPPATSSTARSLNDYTVPDFDGSNDSLSFDGTADGYLGTHAFGGTILFNVDATIAEDAAAPYNERGIISTINNPLFMVTFSTAGVRVTMLQGGSTYVFNVHECAAGGWHIIQFRYDGQYLESRLDSGAWSSVGASPNQLVSFLSSNTIRLGIPALLGGRLDGRISDVILTNRTPTFEEFDSQKTYVNHRYQLSL